MQDAPGWIAADRAHVWHPYTRIAASPAPIPIVRAEGAWLEAADGRRILDGISSWWVNIHGHNHPRLNRALAEQASRLAQVIFAGFTHEPAARLAAALARRAPPGLTRVFFSDDGSTAVEAALKMAWQLWRNRGDRGRQVFVALEHAYHGDTFGAMAAGGVPIFHERFRDLLFAVRRVHPPDCPACRARKRARLPEPEGPREELSAVLAREGDRVAAVIIEPVLQGAGGMIVWPADFLREAREATAARGIPLIADEVLTGFGRTGKLFACEHGPVTPDILCLSKALTGGYLPLGATLVSEEIHAAFAGDDPAMAFFHGHSYTGNALACAVALESLRVIDDERSLERVAALERLFAARLERLRGRPGVIDARGIGAVAAVEAAPEGTGGYLDAAGPRFQAAFLARGILLRPLGNIIYFLPPYAVTDAEAHRVFDAIEEVLGEA